MEILWINRYPSDHILVDVDPAKLARLVIESFKPDERKLEFARRRFAQGWEMYAPVIGKGGRGSGIIVADGRHRILVAVEEGLPSIKICVFPDEVDFILALLE